MKKLLLAATVLTALVPAAADAKKKQPVPPPPPVVRVAPTDPVEAYYYHHGDAPIWFRDAASRAAGAKLSGILRRSTIDGFAYGPQLAVQVDAALAQAASGNPAAIKAAELTLSKAWVAYLQHLRKPPQGLIYGYALLQPHSRADQILLTAAASGSGLGDHLDRSSDVNAIYKQMRDAALAQGMTVPDERLLANLERARILPSGGRFILVDAATQRLWMYENGQPVDSMKVIVGTPETPTPMIASIMHYVTLNPYWNVPPNLIRKTVAPSAVKQGQAYLKRNGYEVVSGWEKDAPVIPAADVDWKAIQAGKNVRIRQLPGPLNSMGKMKFPFPSGQDIYLHDTPSKDKFSLTDRALSNGCIRLEDAQRLARWLMRGQNPVPPTSDPEQFVTLPQGVPIYLTYLTAQPANGKLTYTDDFYGWDGRPERQAAAAMQVPPGGLR